MKPTSLLILCAITAFASCKTQGDFAVQGADSASAAALEEIQNIIVSFDAGHTKEELASARRQVSELESRPIVDKEYRARLAAWSGRLFLLEGSRSEAARKLAASREALPGDIQAAVLASRLEGDGAKRLALIDEALKREAADAGGELYIERARTFLDMGHYRDAVAAFDTALPRLPLMYTETYKQSRDKAWDMRSVQPGAGAAERLAQLDTLSWQDAIELTKSETGLLTFLTAGRDWPAAEIFTRLRERGFIPMDQNVNNQELIGNPLLGDTMTRAGAAWYLWHLVAENRADKSLLERYSIRYKAVRNPRSPIPDVPLWSAFFNVVCGSVEWEIMNLPDGKNFQPGGMVRGTAFLAMLAKATSSR